MLGLAMIAGGWWVRSVDSWRAAMTGEGVPSALRPFVEEGAPALVLLVDPSCEACRRAADDLPFAVRPEDFGLRTAIVAVDSLGPPGPPAPRYAGPFPAYLLVDENGTCRARMVGYRAPSVVRAWIEAVSLDGLRAGAER